ncbi:MAG: FumA C-terminus/TtdB family hydratase beta subunit [Candidatus Njordarchaeum guaymaensis]
MSEYHLKTPIKEEDIRKLRVGDIIYIDGIIVTARDEAHKKALEIHEQGKKLPIDFKGLGLYHCGPIVKKIGNKWKVIAAGPTTSTRMEGLEPDFVRIFKPRVIIGKGGLKENSLKAFNEVGVVYGAYTGGAAALAAGSIKRVVNVFWLEDLGIPEALWVFEVKDFGPLVVAMDAHMNSIYQDLMAKVVRQKEKLLNEL